MSASLAEGHEHGGHVLPTPLNTRELRCIVLAMCSPGRERMHRNGRLHSIPASPFDLHARSAGLERGILGGFFNQRLIAMGKVLALGWAKRMQLNPAGLGARCG
jgi:hypothetical protein